jgi:predicted nucleic acid-binding protein
MPARLLLICNTFLVIHVCNLGEVYYDFLRDDGREAAEEAWARTLALPLELRRDANDAFIQRAGTIKVAERVSFADAFALALSERLQVPLVTTDHHEFDPVEQRGLFRFLWLR